ncbi:MAG TPA: TetR/AcrR family transcriptional regulator [Ideonella sp.]|uniref:TetR/AcrR family transcriptional regulator n=1 Tax=Ideonella sp. TaxID=1929293 RepID=UPI002B6E731E|nr:TetR/AcrR family transcriptional regulator [Ideonella sp.]HSI51340.1 TetR/AcrR family transcriptional regulator [Ideonella sp.]
MKVRTEARRSAIVLAAAELFQEMGYERASMNELARRFGGSKATLYGYFPSKEALFVAVVETLATANLADAVDDLSQANEKPVPLRVQLTRFGERMLHVLVNDEKAIAVYRMVVAESGHSVVGQLFYESGPAQSIEAIAKLISAAMAREELRRTDPKVMAQQFFALLTAEINNRVFQNPPPPVSETEVRAKVKLAVEMFLLGAVPR